MPLPGVHAARQISPDLCDKIRTQVNAAGPGITINWCIRAGKPVEAQSIHFDAGKFTADEAKAWLAKHQFKSDQFEAASHPQPKAVAADGATVEIRASATGTCELIAQAPGGDSLARVSMLAYSGVPMRLEGFSLPVVVDLESLRMPKSGKVPILRGHNADRIAGHSDALDLTPQRLKASGILSGTPEQTADILSTAGKGFPWQVSIGAQTAKRPHYVPAGERVKVNGRNWDGPILVARNAALRELSLLPIGADSNTDAGFAPAEG